LRQASREVVNGSQDMRKTLLPIVIKINQQHPRFNQKYLPDVEQSIVEARKRLSSDSY